MKRLLVLGIGNRLMMDDGIGVYVVENLLETLVEISEGASEVTLRCKDTNIIVQYVVGETDIDYCMESIREAAYIIIVDAVRLGRKPGTVSVIPLQEVSRMLSRGISVHEAHLLNEIKLLCTDIQGIFIGIEPYEIDYSLSLSSVLKEKFSLIVDEVHMMVTGTCKKMLLTLSD